MLEWFLEDAPLRWESSTEQVYRICPVDWRALQPRALRQVAPEIREAQQQFSSNVEELGKKLIEGLRLMRAGGLPVKKQAGGLLTRLCRRSPAGRVSASLAMGWRC